MPAAAYGRFCILLSCALAFTALSFPPEIAAAYDSPLEAGFLATNDRSLLDTNMLTRCGTLWQANTSRIELPAVPYGTQGPWTINLWFKPSSEYGGSFQYLYSHNSTQCYNYTACPYAANQIRLYYPETGHPAYGVIRALVKDSTDTSNRGSYTDSDGRVGVDYQSVADGPPAWGRHFLADDLWHMLTLTTLSNNASGLQGYIMSLDGQQMAYQAADQFYAGADGSVFTGSDGGRPMQLDGQIVLCDHSDSTFPRNYDGALSHLSIYDNALNYSQVLALFHQVCSFLCQMHMQTLAWWAMCRHRAEVGV
ncbi:TPA: hypothetical protein ACH3X2_000838 [Trebouxia sp. C0005]